MLKGPENQYDGMQERAGLPGVTRKKSAKDANERHTEKLEAIHESLHRRA